MNWKRYAESLEELISLMDPSPTKTLLEHLSKESKEKIEKEEGSRFVFFYKRPDGELSNEGYLSSQDCFRAMHRFILEHFIPNRSIELGKEFKDVHVQMESASFKIKCTLDGDKYLFEVVPYEASEYGTMEDYGEKYV